MRRILVIGIVAALLTGILVATAAASVQKTTVEDVDDTPMTIPSGKIGDEVVYAWFFQNKEESSAAASSSEGASTSSGGHASASDEQGWQAAGAEVMRIERLAKSVDRQGRSHDAIVVRSNSTFGDYSGTSVAFVELAARSLIRSDYESEFQHFDKGTTLTFSTFHTPGEGAFFEHQGQTYTLGQEIPQDDGVFDCDGAGIGVGTAGGPGTAGLLPGHRTFHVVAMRFECDDLMPKVVSAKTWVANRGTLDGHDAYSIRSEVVLQVADVIMTRDSNGEFRRETGEDYEYRAIRDTWVSADVPYVLLDETIGYRDGEETGRSQYVLQKYAPGSVAIPWKDAALAPVPTPERSGAVAYPADGADSDLPYPLATALADVTGTFSPLQFQSWKESHPDAVLVAARMQIGENSRSSRPSYQWSLFYASPNGEAHEVATERLTGLPQPLVTDRGDRTVPAFDRDVLPTDLITIAEAERAWEALASDPYVGRAPNFVSWGFDVDPTEGPTCLGAGSASSNTDAEAALRTLYVGWTTEGSCAEVPQNIDASVVALDAEKGELLALIGYQTDYDLRVGPVTAKRATLETQNRGGALAIASPDIAVATVTSTSLLAIFLAAYFLPALKVVGAQALLLLPGYAKLRKEAILDNKIRDQILEQVKQDPGASITDLAKKVDAGWGTIVYHLGVLEKNKMVSMVLDGRHRRVFPVGLVDFSGQGQLALLKNERVRELYQLIHEEPGVFQDQLAKRVGISAPATSWHLKRLEDAGLVGRVKDGRRVHYYANEAAKKHDPEGMEVA